MFCNKSTQPPAFIHTISYCWLGKYLMHRWIHSRKAILPLNLANTWWGRTSKDCGCKDHVRPLGRRRRSWPHQRVLWQNIAPGWSSSRSHEKYTPRSWHCLHILLFVVKVSNKVIWWKRPVAKVANYSGKNGPPWWRQSGSPGCIIRSGALCSRSFLYCPSQWHLLPPAAAFQCSWWLART